MDAFDAIYTRRSIRKFKQQPIPLLILKKVVEAGRWAPTGANLQYWRFLVITEPHTLRMVKVVSPMYYGEGTAAVVVCLDMDAARSHGITLASSEGPGFAGQNILLAAHASGLGACPVKGFNKKALTEVLEIPPNLEPMLLISLGYADETPEAKPRRPFSETHYLNSFKTPWREQDAQPK